MASDYDRNTRTTTTHGADGARDVYVDNPTTTTTTTTRDTHHERKGGLGRTLLLLLILLALAALAAVAFGLIDVDQTRTAKLPEVNVEGGQAPAFDVDTADVDVGTTNATVEVPEVKVETEKTKVEVPTITVDKANEK